MDMEQTPAAEDAEPERRDTGTALSGLAPALPRHWLLRFWQRSAEVGKGIVSVAGGLIAVLTLVVGAVIVIESVFEKTVTVRPLSVPKALSDDGISPEIVALNLRDGLNMLVDDVKHSRGWETAEIMDPEELPDVAVPSVGLSAQALAADVRAFFKIQNRTIISGEIVSHGDSYALTLRLNGRPFFHSPRGQPRDHLDDVIREGAFAALKLTQPAVAAAVLFDEGDRKQALALCENIIGKREGAEDFRARVLRVRTLTALGRAQEAVADSQATFKLYPKEPTPHANLGAALLSLGRREEAAEQYRAAIALKPNYGRAHAGLGRALLGMGRTDEAMKEFNTGIADTPEDYEPRFSLGFVLRNAGRTDEALEQYRAAAPLIPDHAEPHERLGNAFRALGRHEEAEAEYEKAVTLSPASADAHRRLAGALDDLGRHDEASAERGAADAAERASGRLSAAPAPRDAEKPKGPQVVQGAAPNP